MHRTGRNGTWRLSARPLGAAATVAALGLALLLFGCGSLSTVQSSGTPTPAEPSSAPAAPTEGVRPTASPASLSEVALGDSVTSGYACGCSPFPQQYAARLRQAHGIATTVRNLGTPGLTSGQLLAQLADPASNPSRAVDAADINLITIGANDFADRHDAVTSQGCVAEEDRTCVQDELNALGRNLDRILSLIQHRRAGLPTAILVTGYWNVYEDGDVARASFSPAGLIAARRLTDAADQVIQRSAADHGAVYVDLTEAFEDEAPDDDVTNLLAADGDHPNADGHRVIADRILSAGLPGLEVTPAPTAPADR